jgi:CRISPR-associated endonuclease/helicase Cas3
MPDGSTRRGFRHELASAVAWLINRHDEPNADLIAFLIAAHHGKVRQSLRSMPNETQPKVEQTRFARGVWDGDELPAFMLGNGDELPPTKLDLSLMMLGESNGKPSWLARVLALRNEYGPFRLSFLETLLRVADWRGSRVGEPTP